MGKSQSSGGSWSEIDLTKMVEADEELELQLDDDTEESVEETSDDDDSEEDLKLQEEEQLEDTSEEDKAKEAERREKSQKTSRAQTRIRQLANERRELKKQLEEAQKQLNVARKGEFSVKKSSVETLKTTYEEAIKSKTKEATSALNSGDNEAFVSLQAEISELALKKAALSSWDGKEPEEVKFVVEEDSNDDFDNLEEDTLEARLEKSNIPQEGIKWIKSNPKFISDEVFRLHSIAVNNELIKEGFNPSEADFYEELDARLENLGKKTSTKKTKSRKSDGPSLRGSQRVSGNKKTIQYTKEDVAMANQLGVPLKAYMLNKIALEKKQNGWTLV